MDGLTSFLEILVQMILDHEEIALPVLTGIVFIFAVMTLLQVRRMWLFFRSKRRLMKQLEEAALNGA